MKKRRKKRAILLLVIVVVIIGIIMILLKRQGDGSMSEVNSSIETNEIVRGSNDSGAYYLDVNKTGIFYLDNGRMKYLDYGTKKSYYICDKANCKHKDQSCGSYADHFSGFGAYNGYLYALRYDEETNSADFIQMAMNGTNRKVLATIDCKAFDKDEWYMETLELEDVYYAYGKAYFRVQYSETENFEESSDATVFISNPETVKQIISIDLKTGEKNVLAEVKGTDTDTDLELNLISSAEVIVTKQETEGALSGLELQKKLTDDTFVSELQELLDSLPEENVQDTWKESLADFYMQYARYYLEDSSYSILEIDCDTNEIKEIAKMPYEKLYDSNGMIYSYSKPYTILGWYEGDMILSSDTETVSADSQDIQKTNLTLWRWNLEKDAPDKLLEIDNGALPMMSFGTVGNYVHDGNKIIYLTYCEDGENADIKAYDLETGENQELYQDTKYVTFRFLGETEDRFVGDMVNGDDHGVYILSKDDYYAGNLKEAERLLAEGGVN